MNLASFLKVLKTVKALKSKKYLNALIKSKKKINEKIKFET